MNEYIRSVVTAKEAISLGIVETLYGAFQTFHVRPLFVRISAKRCEPGGSAKMPRNCAAHSRDCQGSESDAAGLGWVPSLPRRQSSGRTIISVAGDLRVLCLRT